MKGKDLNVLLKNKEVYLLMCGTDLDSEKRLQKKLLLSMFHPYICDWLIYTDECLPSGYEEEDFSIPQIKELALMAKSKIQWPELKDFSTEYLREVRLCIGRNYTFHEKTFKDFSTKRLSFLRQLKDMKRSTIFFENLTRSYDLWQALYGIRKGCPVELILEGFGLYFIGKRQLMDYILLFEKLQKNGLQVEMLNELPISINILDYMECLEVAFETGTSWLLDQRRDPLEASDLLKVVHTIKQFGVSLLSQVEPDTCELTALIKGLSRSLGLPELLNYIDDLKASNEVFYEECINALKKMGKDGIFFIETLKDDLVQIDGCSQCAFYPSHSKLVQDEIRFVKNLKTKGFSEEAIAELLRNNVNEECFFSFYKNGIDMTLPGFRYLQQMRIENSMAEVLEGLNRGLLSKSEFENNYNIINYFMFKNAGAPNELLKQLKNQGHKLRLYISIEKVEKAIDLFNECGSVRLLTYVNLK